MTHAVQMELLERALMIQTTELGDEDEVVRRVPFGVMG